MMWINDAICTALWAHAPPHQHSSHWCMPNCCNMTTMDNMTSSASHLTSHTQLQLCQSAWVQAASWMWWHRHGHHLRKWIFPHVSALRPRSTNGRCNSFPPCTNDCISIFIEPWLSAAIWWLWLCSIWSSMIQFLLLLSSTISLTNANRNTKPIDDIWLSLPHHISRLWQIKVITVHAASLFMPFYLPQWVLWCNDKFWHYNLTKISSSPQLYNSTVQYPMADLQLLYFATTGHNLAQVTQPPSIRFTIHRTHQVPSSQFPTMQ